VALRYLKPGFTEKTNMAHLIHSDGSLITTISTTKISFVLHEQQNKYLPSVELVFTQLLPHQFS
jgi:hypothetical protein